MIACSVLPNDLILIPGIVAHQVKMSFKHVLLLVDIQGDVGHCAVVALIVFAATCAWIRRNPQLVTSCALTCHTDRRTSAIEYCPPSVWTASTNASQRLKAGQEEEISRLQMCPIPILNKLTSAMNVLEIRGGGGGGCARHSESKNKTAVACCFIVPNK